MIYLLLGPEEGEKAEWLNSQINKAKSLHPDAEISIFFGGDDIAEGLSVALSQSSLFSSYRVVVIKHYENIKKTDAEAKIIAQFAKEEQEDAELIILSLDTAVSSFPKEVADSAKETTFKFWEMDDAKKRAWIRNYAKKEGFLITNAAIEEILSSVDNNSTEMKNTVASIITFMRSSKSGDNSIDLEQIETYTSRTKGENGYTLFRAVANANLEKSLLIVSSILLSDVRDAIPAITVLANQFRLLESCLELKKKNTFERDIFKNATYVSTYASAKKTNGVFFKDQDTFRAGMQNYTLGDVKNIIIYLGQMDTEIKSASTDMLKIVFEKVIYHIIVEKGRKEDINLNLPLL